MDNMDAPANSIGTIPSWIQATAFEPILRESLKEYHQTKEFKTERILNVGENDDVIVIEAEIELNDRTIHNLSFLLKIARKDDQAQLNKFRKEKLAYTEIIPQFEKIYKDQVNIDVKFAPRSYKLSPVTGNESLLVENLRNKGFTNKDHLEGLDMKHTEAILQKLAKFHAASAYVFETKEKFPEIYENAIQTENISDAVSNIYLECVKQYEGNEEYIDKVEAFLKDYTTYIAKASQTVTNQFNVLNHGNCWTNNVWYRHDNAGNIVNTYFVNFQSLKYGSPCYDLFRFLLSSPKLELKLEYFDYFIHYYHQHLKTNLELLKYPKQIPSLKDLHMDLLEYGTWAMYTLSFVLPVAMLDDNDKNSLEKITSDCNKGLELKKQMLLNNAYRAQAEAILPWLNRRGLLDFKLDLTTKSCLPKECSVPSWVDAEHFEDILKENVKNFEEILNITSAPATKSGDNYASTLLRIKVEYKTKEKSIETISYILKLPLQSEEEIGIVSLWNFFDKEILMYSKYLRQFEEMYRKAGQKVHFAPKYYTFKKYVGKDVLLLEDLSQIGFQTGDRREGLDMEHTKCVLKKLAQFHAVSAKYVEVNGAFPQVFHVGIYTEESREVFKDMKLEFMCDYFKEYEGYEEYKDKLPNLLNNFVDHGIRVSTVDPAEFNVLNHGDSWLNNIMFKHNNAGHIEETYFIDFQVCKYGSPAQDLWYFIMSSTELSLKVDSFDYFIKFYHDNLVQNLNLLEYSGKVPNLTELNSALLKYGYNGFTTFFGVGAVCLLESGENANMTNFTAKTEEGEQFRKALFLNDKYKAHAAIVLPWLAKRGCLD